METGLGLFLCLKAPFACDFLPIQTLLSGSCLQTGTQINLLADYRSHTGSKTCPERHNMAISTPALKVILCGEYGVGKSSIFRRFVDNSFIDETGPRSTIGLDNFTKNFQIEDKLVKVLNLHSFSGSFCAHPSTQSTSFG